jgi:ParB/RepB/Spo0J family partition protein
MTAPTTTHGLDIRYIPLSQVHESPLNTRKHFDPTKLSELASSLKTSKQLTPVLVRPSKLKGKPGFELAAGHRRRRAAELVQLPELLAIVRDLDDRTFLEILTVDNLQREDVHPIEEAEGYKNLLTLEGYNNKLIAERVGKTEAYVFDRLKLLQLTPEAKKLFFADRILLGHAIILARTPAAFQKELIEDDMGAGGLWRRDHGHATLGLLAPDEEKGDYSGLRPVSVRELQMYVDDHLRFDPADKAVPQLFPETAARLALAEQNKRKVVPITYDFHVHPDAKDEDGARTYGPTSWKRADGQPDTGRVAVPKASQPCEYSVMGLVAAGEHRGESFLVCIDKKRCTTHWAEEIRERNKRERAKESAPASKASSKASPSEPAESSYQRTERLRKERTTRAKARWEKGGDAVLRAIVPHVKKLVVGGKSAGVDYFLEVIADGLYGVDDTGKQAAKLGVPRGTTPADLIRHLIMVALLDRSEPGNYDATNEKDLQDDLDELKIKVNVVKLLDAANPEPKPEPKKAGAKGNPSADAGLRAPKKVKKAARKAKKSVADFMKPKQPDAVLAAIVGEGTMPRTEITKKLWQYIKKHDLQDAKERRMIKADDKIKALFGGKMKVSMFEMTKLVNKHIKD